MADDGNLANDRTLRLLFERREEIDEVKQDAAYAAKTGRIEPDVANEAIGMQVLLWLEHVQKIVKTDDFDLDGAYDLWNDRSFGTVNIHPREHFDDVEGYPVSVDALDLNGIRGSVVEFVGLESFFTPDVVAEQSVITRWNGVEILEPDDPQYRYRDATVVARRTIPMDVWSSVVCEVDAWLQNIGIGADTGQTGRLYRTRFDTEDYDDPINDDIPKPK